MTTRATRTIDYCDWLVKLIEKEPNTRIVSRAETGNSNRGICIDTKDAITGVEFRLQINIDEV